MTEESTTGGLLGKVAGKAKEAVGSVVGNDDLAREGRLQQSQADADIEAAERSKQAGFHYHFEKPVQPEVLADLLATYSQKVLEPD